MPIQIPSFFIPRNANSFYLLEDRYIKGGFQVRSDQADRDSIPIGNLKEGMLVLTLDNQKIWKLASDLTTWDELQLGGGTGGGLAGERTTVTQIIPELEPNAFFDFELNLGKTIIVNKLSLSVPMRLEIYSLPDRSDTNPFVFIATADHLIDDGSTLMSDGTVYRSRKYSILSNDEEPALPTLYFRITNTEQLPSSCTISITYIVLE